MPAEWVRQRVELVGGESDREVFLVVLVWMAFHGAAGKRSVCVGVLAGGLEQG
jgi:hypothetical protein